MSCQPPVVFARLFGEARRHFPPITGTISLEVQVLLPGEAQSGMIRRAVQLFMAWVRSS